jgi:hypothetical protein
VVLVCFLLKKLKNGYLRNHRPKVVGPTSTWVYCTSEFNGLFKSVRKIRDCHLQNLAMTSLSGNGKGAK